jgi:hypothetical protein
MLPMYKPATICLTYICVHPLGMEWYLSAARYWPNAHLWDVGSKQHAQSVSSFAIVYL